MNTIECTLCGQRWPVSNEDPDSTVQDAGDHIAKVHGRGPSHAARFMRLIEQGGQE